MSSNEVNLFSPLIDSLAEVTKVTVKAISKCLGVN